MSKECWILVDHGDKGITRFDLEPVGAGYSIDLQTNYVRLYNRDYTVVVPAEDFKGLKCPNKA